ncbi:hypothetical protein ACCT30_48255, partial [Rhizobium ruizarguesonis]
MKWAWHATANQRREFADQVGLVAGFSTEEAVGPCQRQWPYVRRCTWKVKFGKQRQPDLDKVFARVRELLTEMRSSDQLIDRKISVLLGSGDAGKNPYLAGYLTVKWAWHATANQRREFADQ